MKKMLILALLFSCTAQQAHAASSSIPNCSTPRYLASVAYHTLIRKISNPILAATKIFNRTRTSDNDGSCC